MLHHECLCPPVQGTVGVGHDFVARQCREVRKERRVNHWGEGEDLKEGQSEMRQCIYPVMGTHWRGAERGLPVEWHDIGIQACAQGPMRVRCPGLE